jgi:hypothetical protein
MHFGTKNYLKSTRNHTVKQALKEPGLVKEKATRAGQHDHAPGLLFFYPGKWMNNFSSALARLST